MGLYSDDPAVLLPYVLEEIADQLATLVGVGLYFPEAREVFEQLARSLDVRVGRRLRALQLFFDRLAAQQVLGLRQVAEQVEVAQALELRAYFADPEENYWEITWAASQSTVLDAARRAAGITA